VADIDQKALELQHFSTWQQTGSTASFQALYGAMKPLINTAASRAAMGSNIPESAHKIWAAQAFHDSLKTYDPSKGTALQTHVFNAVQGKAKRLNYMYQNLGKITEPRAIQVGVFQNERENLRSELGREASSAEIADRLGWSLKNVSLIQKEVHKDLSLSGGLEETPYFQSSAQEEVLDYLYYELSGEEQTIYDLVWGKHGKPKHVKPNKKIDYERIAVSASMSTSKARQIMGRIVEKLSRALKK
jgi:DNA-directed RNA polymerase specialized sigma subunit